MISVIDYRVIKNAKLFRNKLFNYENPMKMSSTHITF